MATPCHLAQPPSPTQNSSQGLLHQKHFHLYLPVGCCVFTVEFRGFTLEHMENIFGSFNVYFQVFRLLFASLSFIEIEWNCIDAYLKISSA